MRLSKTGQVRRIRRTKSIGPDQWDNLELSPLSMTGIDVHIRRSRSCSLCLIEKEIHADLRCPDRNRGRQLEALVSSFTRLTSISCTLYPLGDFHTHIEFQDPPAWPGINPPLDAMAMTASFYLRFGYRFTNPQRTIDNPSSSSSLTPQKQSIHCFFFSPGRLSF